MEYVLPNILYKKETDVKKTIKDIFKYFGIFNFMPIAGKFAASGIPDFVGILPNGRFIAIEAKCLATKGQLTPLQSMTLLKIVKNGGVGLMINENNFDLLINVLKENTR